MKRNVSVVRFKFRCNILISSKIIKEMPDSVASGTYCVNTLQKAAHKLNQIITEYGLTISVQKTKSVAFKGRDPVRIKIVIDNKITEQVNLCNYLRYIVSYEGELDNDNKLDNILKITGILNNVFRPQKNS